MQHSNKSTRCRKCRKRTTILFNVGTQKIPDERCYTCLYGKPNGAK